MFAADPNTCAAIGGVLFRSGLAYLDRNQVLADLRPPLDRVSSSSDLYRRVLTIAVVDTMAVDRFRVSQGFRRALHQAGSAVCRPAARASLAPDQFVDLSLGPPGWRGLCQLPGRRTPGQRTLVPRLDSSHWPRYTHDHGWLMADRVRELTE